MKICHIITRLIVGGAQENTILSCEGLHARGHDVTLITGPTVGPEGSLVKRAMNGGYRFIESPSMLRKVSPLHDWQARNDLAKLLADIQPDIVHTHSSKAGVLGRIAARWVRLPHVVHGIHGMSFNRTQGAITRALFRSAERYCSRMTEHYVTVCDAMIEQSLAAGIGRREQFTTIYSGMEVESFDPARFKRIEVRRALRIPADAVVVATVARLFRNKGYEDLIPAMAGTVAALNRLPDAPRVHFLWVGDGAQRREYEAVLRGLGIADRVTLTGLVPPEQIPQLLAAADVVAHASRWEGLPRAVVQGLLMRCPAVAYALDGTPEVVIPEETGLLVPAGNVDLLTGAIVHLVGHPELRQAWGQAGRASCLKRFDHHVMVDQLEALYQRLIDSPSRSSTKR